MKYVTMFRTLSLALILALLVSTVPSTPALAAANLRLDPDYGGIGDEIEAWGSGFDPGTILRFYFSDERASVADRIDVDVINYDYLGGDTADTTGSFEGFYFDVPDKLRDGDDVETVRGGTYYVYATDYYKDIVDRVEFTVGSVAEITLDPDDGPVGTEVEITGEGFDAREDITVKYDGRDVDIESGDRDTGSDGEFKCTILIPESTAGDHTITVIGDDSDIEAEAEFTVEPEITISLESGAAGSTITVSGTGFGDEVTFEIFFDGDEIDIASGDDETDNDGSFEATFVVPSIEQGSYDVKVEDDDNNEAEAEFTTAAATMSISPTTGYVGTEVRVTGTGFGSNGLVAVKFADLHVRSVATDANGNFSDRFIVPENVSGAYNVIASDGINTASRAFAVTISVTLSQTTGSIGTNLSVSGNGFSGAVTVKYDDTVVAKMTASATGVFYATFDVPASNHGEHIITASDALNRIQTVFTVESDPPPIPTPLRPENGARERSQTSFQWESVTDPSGVTYTLQVGGDSSFTNIMLEKHGLTASAYTLTETEELSSTSREASYYWRVRAIDGAFNESPWSVPNSFYVSFLPSWVKNTLIGLGALIVALFIFWLGMKTERRAGTTTS